MASLSPGSSAAAAAEAAAATGEEPSDGDIAAAESRRLDGTSETVVVKNERWPALAPEFGTGSHDLTEAGRVVLGREFLLALSHCCEAAKGKQPAVTAAPTEDAGSTD